MKIAVIGCGYVGLVTGASLANLGNDVIFVDIDDEKIADLRKGIIPFFEPGLRDLVEMNLSQKRLMFTTDSELAIRNSDIVFVAVGTPSNADGKADLSAVFAVAEHIARYIDAYKVIVMKSTVPVGTCHKLRDLIRQKMKKPVEFDVVSNPEFLREGEAVNDFMIPDRIVIGVDNGKAKDVLLSIYRPIERTGRPILLTDVKTSELIKYASNAMLAARISFMNELSHLCEKVGADIHFILAHRRKDGVTCNVKLALSNSLKCLTNARVLFGQRQHHPLAKRVHSASKYLPWHRLGGAPSSKLHFPALR